jgi:energy-converting hydrogenase Eha subunit A
MSRRAALVVLSAGHVLVGVAGHVIAVRDGHPYNAALLGWQGRKDRVARDSWLNGTGLSAPVLLIATEAVLTARLARRPTTRTQRMLGVLGAAMTCGYLIEQDFHDAVLTGGWDPRLTPVSAAGFALSLSMAVVAFA